MSLYACWAPEPGNAPPWAEYREGYWYCKACWKWIDHKHVMTNRHLTRVENWYWRQEHSTAVSPAGSAARSAETGTATAGETPPTAGETPPTMPSSSPLPMPSPYPRTSLPYDVGTALSAARSAPGSSEEPQTKYIRCGNHASATPRPLQPLEIPNSNPGPLLRPAASISAAGSTQARCGSSQQSRLTVVGQMPTAESNFTEQFSTIRVSYAEGNVCIAFLRDDQQAFAFTLPAADATNLAAGVTTLMQIASGTVATGVYHRS